MCFEDHRIPPNPDQKGDRCPGYQEGWHLDETRRTIVVREMKGGQESGMHASERSNMCKGLELKKGWALLRKLWR